MAYRLKDYLYNDKLTKEQNILMGKLYKLRMSVWLKPLKSSFWNQTQVSNHLKSALLLL